MSYTTVIGGKLKLKGSGGGLPLKNSGQKSTFQTSIPPRLPISQPYAPGEREEMSKGYLKNAFAKESITVSNIDIKSDEIEKEITPTEKNMSKEIKQKKEGRDEEGDEKGVISRKRGRSEDDSQFDKKEKGQPSFINKTQQSLSSSSAAEAATTSSSSSLSTTTTTTTTLSSSTAAATVSDSISSLLSTKTSTQLRFEEAQRKRLHERAKKEATKSHREKIEDLNKLLETMPEHYDLFRISYGGQG